MISVPITQPKKKTTPIWKFLTRAGAFILLADTFGNLTTEGYDIARGFIVSLIAIALTYTIKR